MRWGLYSGGLEPSLPYVTDITGACAVENFPVAVAYAVAWHETIEGETNGLWSAATVVSDDGGHGLFQLTSSYPDDWQLPKSNADYALTQFLVPFVSFWFNAKETGDNLVRCVAASFNAGLGGAQQGHSRGDVDLYTTDRYGEAVLAVYLNLLGKGKPS